MKSYDLIVIGGGPAGYSAALYAARFEMSVAVIAENPGGLITKTHLVENYPGLGRTDGFTVGTRIKEHAEDFGAVSIFAKVSSVRSLGEPTGDGCPLGFEIVAGGETYRARAVILATGAHPRKLDIPGVHKLENKGVSYCATCDGAFYRGVPVGVVGGGDSAAKEALLLADFASEVHVFVRRDEMRAEPINATRLKANPKIHVHFQTEVAEVLGDDSGVTGVRLTNDEEVALQGLFFAVGYDPESSLAAALGCDVLPSGYIPVSREMETSVPGIFAAGDVTATPVKQAITAAADGVRAAIAAYELLARCSAPTH